MASSASALSSSLATDGDGVRVIEEVAFETVGKTAPDREPWFNRAVFPWSYRKQMVRIAAGTVLAGMMQVVAIGDLTYVDFIRQSVSPDRIASYPYPPVPTASCSMINPTTRFGVGFQS